jgi:hypothetical protein
VKKKVKKKDKEPKKAQAPIIQEKEESIESFNFGGLPQRDLKKNLGCG